MLKSGIYRTLREHYTIEKHGGAILRDIFFWFLCFYLPEKSVGLFGASKNFLKPYFENNIDLKGEITLHLNDKLEFYIFNKDTGVNIRYIGSIKEDHLYLKYYHENKPEEVFEDVFEYIGTGESA
jgi:hypothetical protein